MGASMLSNPFGRFDASGSTFSITDHRTPMPWTNVVCNGRYGFVVSQNGGGFSWLDNSQLNVLTRWDMDMARDDRGRFLYLADLDSNLVWSLSPAPCWTRYSSYRCDHRPGSTTFATEAHGVRAEWTLAVPPGETLEVWHVTLTNTTDKPRRLRIASFFEWCCGVAPDVKREFHRLFITVSHDPKRRAIVATKNMWDLPRGSEKENWNKGWPYAAAHAFIAPALKRDLAIGDKSRFLGRYGEQRSPAAMTGEPITAGFGRFGDAAASLGGDFDLAPGASIELGFLIAIDETQPALLKTLDRYRTIENVRAAVNAAREDWNGRLAATSIDTGAADFDAMNNTWLPYQAISARIWGRTGYYQQSGAYGFRDQLQDSQVWLPIDPDRTRKQINLHAAHQFADGSVYHWWHPLAEFGPRTACSDDYLWLPFVVCSYIRETGDLTILQDRARFVDDKADATLLNHCLRSFRRSFQRTSPRGLPLIGSCDWNDGLSAMGTDEKGESTWLAFFLISLLADFARVLRLTGDDRLAADFDERRAALIKVVNDLAWDGQWFRRATKDNGQWIGAASNTSGRIYLNAQTWPIIADATDPARAATAWNSVKQHLLQEMGPLLLEPAYTEPDGEIGYITRYCPGSRENGGVYMHAATWALMAACKIKDAQSVGKIWKSISPPLRAHDAERYRAEPYVTPGNIDGPLSDTPGKAGWTWYTGSAAWLNRVSLEWILGLRPTWEGLLIDPCPFPELGRVDVTRTWRGRRIRLRFDAVEHSRCGGGLPTLTVNGQTRANSTITTDDAPPGGIINAELNWAAPRITAAAPIVAKAAQEISR
ncbi:MAG: glycosyl transferase family 36 [Phycisphaerae bacterium]|nr:glycosyl transferase family 36 [Phycisphaerae bacterium]